MLEQHYLRPSYHLVSDYGKPPLGEWDEAGRHFLNVWQGFKHEAQDIALCANPALQRLYRDWLDFLYAIICNKKKPVFDYVCAWIAHLFQKPGEKCGAALFLRGGEGTGKSVFYALLQEMIGEAACYSTCETRPIANTPAYFEHLLVNFDHFQWNARNANLRSWITDSRQSWGSRDIKTLTTYTRYLLTGERHSINLPKGQRRYFIFDLNEARKNDYAYFSNLVGSIEKHEKIAAVAPYMRHFFSTYNIAAWKAFTFTHVPPAIKQRDSQTRLEDFLVETLRGHVAGVYFWTNQKTAYNKPDFEYTAWTGDIAQEDFRNQVRYLARRFRDTDEWLFVRSKDLSERYGFSGLSPGEKGREIKLALEKVFGYNMARLQVNGKTSYVKSTWFVVNRREVEQWITN
jgi:hypothetical protein